MSGRAAPQDLRQALAAAARAGDERFDAAFDALLEQASEAANPGRTLHRAVTERLRAELANGLAPAGGDAPGGSRRPGSLAPEPSLVRTRERGLGLSRRAWRLGRGLALLGAGVAIGFSWGRAPVWREEVPAS
jgi:hypothetical protein